MDQSAHVRWEGQDHPQREAGLLPRVEGHVLRLVEVNVWVGSLPGRLPLQLVHALVRDAEITHEQLLWFVQLVRILTLEAEERQSWA